jgi:hypothetical protein
VPTPTRDLKEFVGKQVRIERDGVTHKGMLMGEVYRHVRSRPTAYKRWVLFTVDDRANGHETYFKANDGWTVKLLRRKTAGASATTLRS